MTNPLERAIAALDAVQLPDGDYAYYDDAMGRWYAIDESDLTDVQLYQDHPDEYVARDWYSHWCAGTCAREMTAGWDPHMLPDMYLIEYIDGGDCCADCCTAVERLAADHSVVSASMRDRIDAVVGQCEYHCRPSQSHRWYDHTGARA